MVVCRITGVYLLGILAFWPRGGAPRAHRRTPALVHRRVRDKMTGSFYPRIKTPCSTGAFDIGSPTHLRVCAQRTKPEKEKGKRKGGQGNPATAPASFSGFRGIPRRWRCSLPSAAAMKLANSWRADGRRGRASRRFPRVPGAGCQPSPKRNPGLLWWSGRRSEQSLRRLLCTSTIPPSPRRAVTSTAPGAQARLEARVIRRRSREAVVVAGGRSTPRRARRGDFSPL